MAATTESTWMLMARKPTHPGETLREEFMAEFSISVAPLAKMFGISRQSANELARERHAVRPDMALRLGKPSGMSSLTERQRNIVLR